jgi:hypothetical protein
MRRQVTFLLIGVLTLSLLAQAAHAGPPSNSSSEDYEKWVKDQYLPSRQGEAGRVEDEIKDKVQGWAAGTEEPTNWRGTTEAKAQENAEWDELHIKDSQFKSCNDQRITIWGDPERRPPRPCQEEQGFFDKPNAISFMCPFGIFENACGSDRETGFELGLLCASDPGACGVHYDNKHPGMAGVIGIGIISKVKAPPFSPCTYIYVTGTYVEYYFPWMMLNTSRQMYQSSYLVEDVSEELRQTGQDRLRLLAAIETGATVDLVAQSGNNTVKALLGNKVGDALPAANPERNKAAKESADALQNIDDKFRDISPHGSRQYTRNFSAVTDIRFQQSVYWYVPHYPLDTHRFGTEFPDLATPIDIPMPTGTYESLELSPMGGGSGGQYRGGLLHSRFLSMSDKTGGNLKANVQKLIAARGATRCIGNNKASGKTPQDFLTMLAAGKDPDKFCIDKIGPRFPLMSLSFSPHDTDAFWRGILSGGLDLFYALNWPPVYGADRGLVQAMATIPPFGQYPFHTYFDDYDRVALSPNPESSDPNFANEITQCGRIQDIADYNVNYARSNIHKPLWGAQNTVYVYGLVKGIWAFRGQRGLYTIENGQTRYPDIDFRWR